MDSKPSEMLDLPKLAREQVQIGPPASWIDSSEFDKKFTPQLRGETTYLLIEKQIHAELGQTYVHGATRLESQDAVRAQSQGQINFDPQTESLLLHSITIRRGESETEHAHLDRIQFLQRETGLERQGTIGGQITLLLLLEDVRPGDILEYSYTVTARSRVMPENITAFFSLPPGTEIGKYRFLIQHAEKRAVRWKASSPDFKPQISTDNGVVRCCWTNTNYASPELEACVPPGHLLFPWIQVSDCPDWQSVARAVLAAWEKEIPGDAVARMVEEITNSSVDPLARVTKAIETVQDEFRYLSVNVELGGQIPAAPDVVIRRRYGDCKDVAFLLVQLLRALGLRARPVLVHAHWIHSIASMLPSPDIFNHAIVEYEIDGEKRWVDGTAKNQGGGALNRSVPDFGFGLPIDADTTDLATVPKASLLPGSYDVKESMILCTSGGNSFLAVVITRTGAQADAARNEFVNRGIDAMAKDRLQFCANRFSRAGRIRALECRDDRDANEFVLAEAFEVVTPIRVDRETKSCLFQIRSDIAAQLVHPGLATRRYPLALPFPVHWTHTVEIEFAGLNGISLPFFQVGNSYFTFGRRCRNWPNFLKVSFSLETLKDSIPPGKLDEHRKNVESVYEAGVIHLRLPLGYSTSRRRADFGALPAPNPSRAGAGNIVVSRQQLAPAKAAVPVPTSPAEKETITAQKTEEMVAMPAAAKPMPPAREAVPLQTIDPKKSNTLQRRPRKPEKRCAWSFYLVVFSAVAFLSAMPIARYAGKAPGGFIVMFVVLPTWLCSLVLAIFGWRQTTRHPGRYTDTSRLFATLTFTLGGMAGLVLVPMTIYAFTRGVENANTHARHDYVENTPAESRPVERPIERFRSDISSAANPPPENPLDFKEDNFTFHPPGSPWERVSSSDFGPNVLYALWRPGPMTFTIIQQKQRPGAIVLDPRRDVAEASKNSMRKTMESSRVVGEKEVTYHGMAGWEIETQGIIRGHDTCFVQWVYATNGIGYQLSACAPRGAQRELELEAIRLFAGFELTPSQQITSMPNP